MCPPRSALSSYVVSPMLLYHYDLNVQISSKKYYVFHKFFTKIKRYRVFSALSPSQSLTVLFSIYQKILRPSDAWLVDDTIHPAIQCILFKIVRFFNDEDWNVILKAIKFCKIFTLLLSYVVLVKSQNFVAFSEYMNFKRLDDFWAKF